MSDAEPDAEPDAKPALRRTAYAARKAAFDARAATGAVARATGHLLAEIGQAADRVIAGYTPMRTEIDPIPAMTALNGAGARLCVPVIVAPGQPLDFREWVPGCALTDGPFGAQVPEGGDWLTPDTLIVPLVGFDAACNRLGYGGGFYDRTLARLTAAAPTRAIGLAFAAQELPHLPVEPTDYLLDAVVTEDGVVRAGRGPVRG